MNEGCAVAVFVDAFKIDYELAGVVLGVGEDLGTKEGDDVLANDFARFLLKVRVVDAEAGVEPVNFIGNELLRDESLQRQ